MKTLAVTEGGAWVPAGSVEERGKAGDWGTHVLQNPKGHRMPISPGQGRYHCAGGSLPGDSHDQQPEGGGCAQVWGGQWQALLFPQKK